VLEASEGFGLRHHSEGKTPALVMNDFCRDLLVPEDLSRFQAVKTLAEGEADHNRLGETGGTYSGASPKASFRETPHDQQYKQPHSVNTKVRIDKLVQAPPKSALKASFDRRESRIGGVWPA